MESKHTDGPWEVCIGLLVGHRAPDGTATRVCECHIGPHAQANARLIAAAPDLLQALRDVVELFEWEESDSAQERAYDAAVAAIGKATSQTT